jgi:hypothetical protein
VVLADGVGTGTGFAIGDHTALTAGHMCAIAAGSKDTTMWLEHGNAFILAHVVAWELTPDPSADLCVLHTDAQLGPPMILAATDPPTFAQDTIVGYPHGEYAETHGTYVGEGLTTAHSDHGSSGSPAWTPHGVYGVVVQGWADGSLRAAVCPLKEIKRFLDELGVSYTTGPYVL